MRKHDSTPISYLVTSVRSIRTIYTIILICSIQLFSEFETNAQCIISNSKIKGEIFYDADLNGIKDATDKAIGNIQVNAYNQSNNLIASAISDLSGKYELSGLVDGQSYRIDIIKPLQYEFTVIGSHNKGDLRIATSPSCEVYFGLFKPNEVVSNPNSDIVVSVFNKAGTLQENQGARSLVTMKQKFSSNSPINNLTTNGQTGSIYGLAWNKSKQLLYASAFVKQYSSLGPLGLGGIYAINRSGSVQSFVNLVNEGINLGSVQAISPLDCNYGSLVGKVGLGNMDLTDDDRYLLATNLHNRSLIIIPTNQPSAANIVELNIPNPGCSDGDYAVSAIKYYNGLVYIGVTCTGETKANNSFASLHVYELNLLTRVFNLILSTDYTKGYWLSNPKDSKSPSQWLTDIDFNNRGEMMLGIADRTGHTFCAGSEPLTNQSGDILVAFKNNNTWILERGGIVNGRAGTGVGHYEGPGQGEFFGEDFWVIGPSLHPEVSFGTLASTSSSEVINVVFDPDFESFAGGLHRYNTDNGKLVKSIEIYNRNNSSYGKSSGLGDIEIMNDPIPIEIGNLVWYDQNKNGIQEPNEKGLDNIELSLYNSSCQKVGLTKTDINGNYLFNNSNVDLNADGKMDGLAYGSQYYIVITESRFNKEKHILTIGTNEYELSPKDVNSNGVNDSYDSDASIHWPGICPALFENPAFSIITGNNGQNEYRYDIGLMSTTPVVNPPLVVYDLALVKRLSSLGSLRLNDYVEFSIEVHNQGNAVVDYFEVIDYIPSQFEFVAAQNPGWISEGGNSIYKSTSAIGVGEVRNIPIKLRLINTNQVQSIINVSEICAMKDKDGKDLKDKDSTPDKINNNDKGGIYNSPTDNLLSGDGINDEDDQDPAGLSIYDLALILTTNKTTPVKLNEEVTFQVRICNQGNESVKNVKFIDYLPGGFTLSPNDNNGWILQNSKWYNIINDEIKPGQCATKEIVLTLGEVTDGSCVTNRAEIVSMTNMANQNVSTSDVDSKADEVIGNDAGGVVGSVTDNLLTGNGFNDEDDEDPEQIIIADLALRKVLRPGSVLKYQGSIIYDITIVNQGCVPLKDITIIDYIPSGFDLSSSAINNEWNNINGKVEYNYTNTLNPGSSATISIELKNSSELFVANLNNRAEIVSFHSTTGELWNNYEYDSSPDSNSDNDKGAEIGTVTDDMINDHGSIDEDDHDIATVPVVDMAILKSLSDPKRLYKAGDQVEFKITLINQGNIPVNSTKIVDYVDDGFEYVAANNSGWSSNVVNKKVSYQINETLLPGQVKNLVINLIAKTGTTGTQIPNNVEITSIRDQQGQEMVDYDSNQDEILGNDPYDRSRVDDHGLLDEDDHDRAITNPLNFDLALIKEVNKRVIEPGSLVDWTITIVNQGTIAATEIGLIDYLHDGMVVAGNGWEEYPGSNGEKYHKIISVQNGLLGPQGLLPGESVKVTITTRIDDDARPGILVNNAEIYFAHNSFNEPDEDSVPDAVEDNDGIKVVFEDSDLSGSAGPGDPDYEDDADIAGVLIIRLDHSDCYCLNNASAPGNGQYSVELTLESRKNEVWFIKHVVGLYDPISPAPPAAPIPFVTGPAGVTMTELTTNGSLTVYGLTGIFISDIGFEIILENQFGDKVNVGNVRCSYDQPIVLEAQNNVCDGSEIRYKVQKRPGSTYYWTLSSGGNIISDPSKESIVVHWTGGSGTTHTLTVHERNNDYCLEPLAFDVTIGSVPGAISCIGNAQISLDKNCEARVTARQLLIGGPYDYNSYAVMVFNKNGTLVPNNIVTYEHVGKPLTAKVINTCNGNSCWTTLTVEDKLPPTIVCLNDTIDCTRMRSHLGPFIYDNCDPNPTKILLKESIENTPCNPLYSKIVHRQYIAKDASGNSSKVCNSDYFLKRIDLDSLEFPDSLIIRDATNLSCGHYPIDSLGRPDVFFTGVPTYKGGPIWPNKDSKYCDYLATYEDVVISNTNCIKKIDRIWRFTLWYCTTFTMRVYHQIIEIKDDQAPVIHCPYDKEVFTQSASCNALVYIAPIQAIDSCNNGVVIDLTYPGGIIKNFNGGFITLPVGKNTINIEARDNCYNTSYCDFVVLVVDKAAPVAQCDRETVVSLDRFGEAWVPAAVFDDGSYDNCHLKKMQVRRMDGGNNACNYTYSEFADSVGFCCKDLGKLVTVMFRVTDEYGNSNTCMVQVEVQDKTIPHITCPHDVTVDCDYHFRPGDLSEFGMATASDNCEVFVQEIDSFHINQCNEGYIDRIFIAGNSFGMDVCTQRITVINSHPFIEKNIVWPGNIETEICRVSALHPDSLTVNARPDINEDRCDLVGVSFTDEVFRFTNNSDACFKIIRRWRVINWCRFKDETGNPIIFEHFQIIKSFNKVKPTILSGCIPQRVETQDTSCLGGYIKLVSTATDDCTDKSELKNLYEIDFDRDGRYEISVPGVGDLIDASGQYRLGKHRIKYSFEDLCGNRETCEVDFEIVNAKKPVAYCLKGLAVDLVVMDLNRDGKLDGEFATIWATDFDHNSYHPCNYDLTYSIGRDTSVHSITYTCDSIGRRNVLFCVTASNGQQDCCETFIEVQDNNNINLCGCLTRPNDITLNACVILTDPISINSMPRFGLCRCDSNRVTYNDVLFSNIPNICYRIQRNWKVEFLCANGNEVFEFAQNIDVTTNLKESDIVWPADSIGVDNCDGSIDTMDIGGVPRFCDYGGNVMVVYSDREVPSIPNTKKYIRTWNVFSECVPSQSYYFEQIILVIGAVGTKVQFPADITVSDCRKPLIPDSLNGYPKALCGCDTIFNDFKDDTITNINEICYMVERNWTVHVRCRPTIDTTFRGIQRIVVDVNLDPADIIWPVDTFKSYTCQLNTSIDRTGKPSLKKDYCNLVTFSFADTVVQGATCNTIKRTWTAHNQCSPTQVFKRNQIIISYNQGTIGVTCLPNITVSADLNTCGAKVNIANPSVNSPCNFGITITNNAPSTFPVGTTDVIFTVSDSCKHVATCTTSVTVIENVPPTITCPRDSAVDCSVNTINLGQFGTATATDNCPGVVLKDSVIRNQNLCGIGNIQRYFIATDASGNRSSCKQTITINNNDPLDSLEINWPPPVTVDECAPFGPANTGMPTISQGAASCYKVSITFKDTAFCIPGLCSVDRKWAVFDSCTNNMFMYVQKITRNDTLGPEIMGIKDTTIMATDTSCSGFLNIKAFVTSCDSATVTITNNGPVGNGMEDASGIYPVGTTTVKFTATDGCCNMSMKTITITVVDSVKPEITCKKVIKKMPDSGCADFHASEFLVVVQDNCSPPEMIMASFDKNNFNDTIRTICCDSIKGDQFTMIITVWFKDEAGNLAKCETLLQVIDEGRKVCMKGNLLSVQGLITSRKNKAMQLVPVTLESANPLKTETGQGGYYAFNDMPPGGSYIVRPSLDVDPLEGVSTFDILLIQQHILGKKYFNSPYQHIAADINKSKSITTADISELRKLILGTINKFNNNTSWRFVLADYIFVDTENPLFDQWPEVGTIPDLNTSKLISFKSIKVGDIDDSQKYSGYEGSIKSRSNAMACLVISDVTMREGQEYSIKISLKDWKNYAGAQAALRIDPAYAEILNVNTENSSSVSEDHFNIELMTQGIIKFSWLPEKRSDEWSISIQLRAKRNKDVIDVVDLAREFMIPEAYSKDLSVLDLEIRSVNQEKVKAHEVKLYQNIPNPFNLSTRIPFEINYDSDVTLDVYDINSKLIYRTKGYFTRGYHEIEISKSDLENEGLYYYQIHTATEHINRRMLMID